MRGVFYMSYVCRWRQQFVVTFLTRYRALPVPGAAPPTELSTLVSSPVGASVILENL
jgi:hypothetical protein